MRERKMAADHTGNLDGQLLRRAETVDSTGDHSMQRVGEIDGGEILVRSPRSTMIAVDFDQLAVAQRVDNFLGEKRVAFRLLADEMQDRLGNGCNFQAVAANSSVSVWVSRSSGSSVVSAALTICS